MIYEYTCEKDGCPNRQEVIEVSKPVAEIDRDELCEKCSEKMRRIFSTTTNIGTSSLKDGHNFKSYGTKAGTIKGESEVDYDYLCKNEKCEAFNKLAIIRKKMVDSGRKEKCEECGEPLVRNYGSLSWKWGKDTTRPDSAKRKDDMISAVERGDMDTVAKLNKQ